MNSQPSPNAARADDGGSSLPLNSLDNIITGRAPPLARGPSPYSPEPRLIDHLLAVATRAGRLAGQDWSDLAYTAGLFHDLGKYNPTFQSYMLGTGARVPHSIVGALHLFNTAPQNDFRGGLALAYAVAGHHGALADFGTTGDNSAATLEFKLNDPAGGTLLANSRRFASERRLQRHLPAIPNWATDEFSYSFLIRMIFSTLVDADRLHSEETTDAEVHALRHRSTTIAALLDRLNGRLAQFGQPTSQIARERANLLQQCREAAMLRRGLYNLSASTGLGKTLSSLAFALEHADAHGMPRVIYVAPYTSIIEQTAGVFRDALGDADVVEHHSSVVTDTPDDVDDEGLRNREREKLNRENWDAPVIVTTAVQFFESLFAARARRARKINRIANAVIIIDEAQFLPPAYLRPLVRSMRELIDHYGCTIVLSTATQPDLDPKPWAAFDGLSNPYEIVEDVPGLFQRMSGRVQIIVPPDLTVQEPLGDLADRVIQHDKILTIVNTKGTARDLYGILIAKGLGAYHLSANMCAAHRTDVLGEVRAKLPDPASGPLRLVSTSLIEAGVDVDFPVVFRAISGLDSLAQAAGRCNREGRLASGRFEIVVVHEPIPHLIANVMATRRIIGMTGAHGYLFSAENFRNYFSDLYGHWRRQGRTVGATDPLDRRDVLRKLRGPRVQFREAEAAMRIVEDPQQGQDTSVIVPYGAIGTALCDEFIRVNSGGRGSANLFERTQRYSVNLPERQVTQALATGSIVYLDRLSTYVATRYDPVYGLVVQ
ncbi:MULTISPECIES: CRISPR-associated endonuclease Cas3'' [unclassified Methylobacterium]|uniref:CRISPR-associated endonuclease Cas3'' n=1 Tax=unclassified Methylobacterium TaxID=2615210 RepID=UPI002269FF49|nr:MULTISPECIES: CRISPR-associated endonuclease Cas3'' [unclassified Methylobacterium]